jgi:hypothetical protein
MMTWVEARVEKLMVELMVAGGRHRQNLTKVLTAELEFHARKQADLEDEANQAYTESLLWSNLALRLRTALCKVGEFLEKQPALEIPEDVGQAMDALFPEKRTL